MSSITPYEQNTQGHQPDITAQLSKRIKKLEQENRELKQQILWEDKLFANPNLSPSHKLALRAAVHVVRKADQKQPSLTKIYIPLLAEKTGLSAKTVGKNLQFLADTGALVREAETETDKYGQKITRVFIGLTEQVKTPEQITPPAPRNHGGLRHFCKDCGSENLIEQKTILCLDCGSEQSKITRLVNGTDGQLDCRTTSDETAPPADNLTEYKNIQKPADNLTTGYEKPATPPCPTERKNDLQVIDELAIISEHMSQEQERGATNTSLEMPTAQEAERDLEQATMLLLDIAGSPPEYIAMNTNPAIPKKYVTVHRRLTPEDLRKHVEGRKTLGASLQHQDGTTRALCFDTDDQANWSRLEDAANLLVVNGYMPLLEPSPAQRGGHLWLIFSDHVSAQAAYNQVVTIAPPLQDIREYWPSRREQKVRLPAGKYVTPTFVAWTHLYDASGHELSNNGIEAARILLTHQTPANLVPATAPDAIDERSYSGQHRQTQHQRPTPVTEPDAHHRQKYGNHPMWVEWPSEQYLIDLFNTQHTIDDLATYEQNGMINATHIGRPERTASVGVTPDGERFTDFGAGAQRPDGTQDGGDPFEFYIRSQNLDKSEALRELGRQLNREASRELLRAARAGEKPPTWVMDVITDTGRAIYNQNAGKHGHPPLDADSRGVVGFSTSGQEQQVGVEAIGMDAGRLIFSGTGELWQSERNTAEPSYPQDYEGDYPPPPRPCFHCKVFAWQWTGEQYICSNPGHPPE